MDALFHIPGLHSAPGTAAEAVGAKYWHIQRAARAGHFPVYRPYNSRPFVKLSEVLAYIDSCRQGGGDV